MAKALIGGPVKFVGNAWKGGLASGSIAGVSQGVMSLFLPDFLARPLGGMIGAAMVKNPMDKRMILLNATNEGFYRLFRGEA